MVASASARRRTTVDEFLLLLQRASGDDRHYELIDGHIVAMAPPSRAHSILQINLGRHIGNRLADRPGCTVGGEAAIMLPGSDHDYYEADLTVSCASHHPGQRETPDPVLIIEILSPSTVEVDRVIKLPNYQAIPSVQEILLVAQDRPHVEVYRRFDGDRWQIAYVRGLDAVLRLDSIDLDLPMAEVYRGVALEA